MSVLLIDDHPLILSALQNVIQGMGEAGDVAVVGVAGARAARGALGADDSFDLVLLDLRLGDADGFELLAELRNGWPAIPVVVVSASDRSADVIRSIDLGAMGFVPKRASNETLDGGASRRHVGRHLRAADDDGRQATRARRWPIVCRPTPPTPPRPDRTRSPRSS